MPRPSLLALLIHSLLTPTLALAQESSGRTEGRERAQQLDAITVAADPLASNYGELIKPASVLLGEELEQERASSIGETLRSLPGVQASSFGPGASRPVIRGQDGPRVQVLQEGIASMDVSALSADHAVSIEPFLAEQIEVLRGPATLLYGPGAIGGVVNVLDGRIAERAPQRGASGRAQLGVDSVANARFGVGRFEAGSQGFVLRADAHYRRTDDYRIPGRAEREQDHHDDHHHDDHDDEGSGRLENSAQDSRGGAVGFTLLGDSGFIGLSVSGLRHDYGVPGHGHGHEHEDAALRRLGLKDDDEDEEEIVRLEIEQTRVDLKAGLDAPFAGTESLRLRIGHNDYRHIEFEGEEVGTRFDNREWSGRLDLIHEPINGWRGAYGLSVGDRDFRADGEEAFVPPSKTRQFGLFLVERKAFEGWTMALGARWDRQRIDADSIDERARFSTFSLSAGAAIELSEGFSLSANLDRAARAPGAEELYSDGPHAATASFEVGDPDLDRELANQLDLGVKFRGERLNGSVHVFHTRFDDYLFLADTGEEEDELPLRQWTQGDARFSGIEAEATWHIAELDSGHYDLRLLADRVRGRLTDGGDLPRIPQSRVGAELRWHQGPWRAHLGGTHYFEQKRVAEFETTSDDFTLWQAGLTYAFRAGDTDLEVYLEGRNLGNAEARVHTSLLKDRAPLPGRNATLGVRMVF